MIPWYMSTKKINPLIIERHVLVDSYFYTYISQLLDFDMDDMMSFDTNIFFIIHEYKIIKNRKEYASHHSYF